jgi:TonB family protein
VRFASGLLLFLLSVAAHAQTAAEVALLVNEAAIDAAPLATHVASKDALTRATAARIVTVRGVTALLPQVREALAAEANAEAAREQIRALALLGNDEDIAFAAKQLPRYPASLDSDFTEAIARRGAPQATALYLKYLPELRHPLPGVRFALWGRTPLIAVTASRFLAVNDARAFDELLDALLAAQLALDAGIVTAALRSDDASIRTETIWYLAEGFAADPSRLPAVAEREGAMATDERFGREVLRRMRGGEFRERPEWLAWLRTFEGRNRFAAGKPQLRFLTLAEQKALRADDERPTDVAAPAHSNVRQPSFTIPLLLPPGLGAQLLSKARCRDSWIGVVDATVDRTGRVQAVDSSRVHTNRACRRALDTMLRLSFAAPVLLAGPLTTSELQVTKPADSDCVDDVPAGVRRTQLRRPGGDVKGPIVVRRVEPVFPMEARNAMKAERAATVVAEAVISSTGCVRDMKILSQALSPQLNTAVILALAKWKFKPGTLDGQPVDVLFNLTVSFKLTY